MPVSDEEIAHALEDVSTTANAFVAIAEPYIKKYQSMLPADTVARFWMLHNACMQLLTLCKTRVHERNPRACSFVFCLHEIEFLQHGDSNLPLCRLHKELLEKAHPDFVFTPVDQSQERNRHV